MLFLSLLMAPFSQGPVASQAQGGVDAPLVALKRHIESRDPVLSKLLTDDWKSDDPDLLLQRHLFLKVTINPEGRVKVDRGAIVPELVQGKASLGLIRIHNQAGTQEILLPQKQYFGSANNPFELEVAEGKNLSAQLSGKEVEYKAVSIRSSRPGKLELTIGFSAGKQTQDLGFRGEVPVLFEVKNK